MMNRVEVTYQENMQLWKLTSKLKEIGYKKVEDCYWIQIFKSADCELEIVAVRESDSDNDPLEDVAKALEAISTVTTSKQEDTANATQNHESKFNFMDEFVVNFVKNELVNEQNSTTRTRGQEGRKEKSMTAREEYIHRVAQKIKQHPWYENTPVEECLGMTEYQVSQWEKYEAEKEESRKRKLFNAACEELRQIKTAKDFYRIVNEVNDKYGCDIANAAREHVKCYNSAQYM